MSDQAEIDRIAAEQRATPDDLRPQEAPEPDPAPVQAAEAPEAPEAVAPVPEAAAPEAPEQSKPKKKTATDHLIQRNGNLQQRLAQEAAEKAALQARLEAAEALLNARGAPLPADAEHPPAPAPEPQRHDPAGPRTYTPEEFQAAVAAQAQRDAVNRQANAVYQAGTQAFPDFPEVVAVLNATGVMSDQMVEAALAVGDEKTSAAVLHHLGADVEEAQRIAALPPARMGVELAKIATQLAKPAEPRVSAAPPPIPSVRGAVNPVIDIGRIADSDDMNEYVAARAKQGDPWAQPRGQRGYRQ